jgi:hypothetical protein
MKREGIVLRDYGRRVLARALADSPYEPVMQLIVSRNALLFSERSECVAKLLKIIRRYPQMVLMGQWTKYSLSHKKKKIISCDFNVDTLKSSVWQLFTVFLSLLSPFWYTGIVLKFYNLLKFMI